MRLLKNSTYLLALVLVGLALLVGATRLSWASFPPSAYAADVEPVRLGQENSVRSAVLADGRLWLLSDAGEMWSVTEDAPQPVKIDTRGPIVALCTQKRAIVALQSGRAGKTLLRWNGTDWADIATLPASDEGVVNLSCEAERLTVITSQRLFEFEGQVSRVVTLSDRIPSAVSTVVLATSDRLFVGANAGEWGGGLKSIDRRTGEVLRLERNATGKLCGGPLNTDCDPVNGVVLSPWKPGCVVAAVGLIHMSSHGSLVEVCGADIATVYSEPCPGPDASYCSTPFFGLMAENGRLIAVSPKGVTVLNREGRATPLPAPIFKQRGPFQVAFTPTYVLVQTTVNRRRSVGGPTPLLVSR